ncbi:uncharacterized protein LOC112455069 [Temnothorax curvispinosus]|uniref:Uncharacterized protein LOC112455069 n=1 Tax=Temnothorax curvispinosus TaxID=300111 RepID=A0A6J1PTB0_9HYME|nr:uncharacterized protein LOC112455069 [Temnothorax curvispinosus]
MRRRWCQQQQQQQQQGPEHHRQHGAASSAYLQRRGNPRYDDDVLILIMPLLTFGSSWLIGYRHTVTSGCVHEISGAAISEQIAAVVRVIVTAIAAAVVVVVVVVVVVIVVVVRIVVPPPAVIIGNDRQQQRVQGEGGRGEREGGGGGYVAGRSGCSMNLGAPHWELASLGRGTTTTTKRVLFSGDSNSTSSSSIRERRHRQADERHEVVQEVQVARQEEETKAEVVDYYERVALPLLLSPSRELLAGIAVVAATTAAAATIAVAAVSVGRANVPEITVAAVAAAAAAAAASRVAPRTAFREHEESSVGEQSACREAGLRFGGSDAGPPAAARLRHGSSTQRVHHESSFLSSTGVRDTEEKEAAAARRSVGFAGERRSTSRRTATNVRAEERRRRGARRRRQDVGDVSVPDYPVAPMRLDPFELTGPPTSKKWRKGKRREQKEEKEQQLWLSSSSSLSSISFVECVRSDRAACHSYTSSRPFPKSIRDRVVDDGSVSAAQHHHEARHYEAGHGPDEKAGTATAFRISRDFASRGEVRARTRDRQEDDHEDEDDNDSDALRARTRILRADRSSPRRRRAPRFARRARRRSRRRRGSGAISEDGPDVATSAVSFVDVHAYTAYNDDRDDDDDKENDGDDDDDNEGQTHCERKRIHGGSEEIRDEYEEDENDDNARVSVSNNPRRPGDEYEHENANENAPREDYIRTEMDASIRGVFKSDQWASQSSSFDGKKDRERVDDYDCGYPTMDEVFDGQARRKGERCSERRRTDNTAWFQKPITRRKGRGEGEKARGTGDKPRIRRSYYRLLLFVLYLLAWPLLCSSSPSGHLASTFAQNPTFAHAKNPAHRGNATPPDPSLFSSSTVIEHQYQHSQQYVQGSDTDHNTDSERHRHHQQQQQQQQKKEEQQEQSDQENSEQRHPYNEYTWEVNMINPWLSACDLAGPAPTDLQGSCGAREIPEYCPNPCENASGIMKTYNMEINRGVEDGGDSGSRHGDKYSTAEKKEEKEQCLLYLEESHKKIICQKNKKTRNTDLLRRLRLRHCCEHAVFNALAPGGPLGVLENVLEGNDECNNVLDKLLQVDALAARLHCEFEEVLQRYDCAQPYSVIHNCTHCKVQRSL